MNVNPSRSSLGVPICLVKSCMTDIDRGHGFCNKRRLVMGSGRQQISRAALNVTQRPIIIEYSLPRVLVPREHFCSVTTSGSYHPLSCHSGCCFRLLACPSTRAELVPDLPTPRFLRDMVCLSMKLKLGTLRPPDQPGEIQG
jgi:hypothetical protein